MEDLIERALTAKIETAAITTVNAAITEAGTQADKIVGTDPLPGSPEWEAEQDTRHPGAASDGVAVGLFPDSARRGYRFDGKRHEPA